jgi:hypothetical protein
VPAVFLVLLVTGVLIVGVRQSARFRFGIWLVIGLALYAVYGFATRDCGAAT